MGRKKKAVAAGWNAINKQRDKEHKKLRESQEKDEKISDEDHEARIKMLKDLGLIR